MSPRNFIIVGGLGFGQIVAFASSYYLLGVLADPIADAFSVSSGAVFAALSAAFLLSAILTPTVGRWIERVGARRVLAASNLVFCLALSLMAAAPEPWVLYLGVASLGG